MPGAPKPAAHGLVAVARVAKPHGIRGELCMDSHAGSPLLFAPGQTLFLAAPAPGGKGGPGRPKAYAVAASRGHTGRVLVTLKGVDDRTAADALRGAEVFVAEADLPPPDEGEEYLHRLLGCRVLLQDGTVVGVFEAILDTPGQLTWVIRAHAANGAGAEILFPAVPEFILALDAKRGEIVIDPPPGLLELYMTTPQDTTNRKE
ncbi:MAG: ribosome maturation factor RimM [Proteobacteria bacterium]|nr:ribosome maturation factor RimM [Pseudomonadota bacterium]MBU1596572.1 ribosome maturation factor RimM [Pseudomonadota bacterium]